MKSTKAADMKRRHGGNVAESIGLRTGTGPAAGGPARAAAALKVPEHLKGVDRIPGALAIPLDLIEPDPEQPRKDFDPEALARLAENLKARGQLQPARVRLDESRGRYVLVAGERRYRAAALAGLGSLACVVVDRRPTAAELRADQLAENCAREDLAPLELARALRDLGLEHGWSTRRLADETGLSQSTVSQTLALLDAHPRVRNYVEAGELAPSAAYEISKLPQRDQPAAAERAVIGELGRDEIRSAVKSAKAPAPAGASGRHSPPADPPAPAAPTVRLARGPDPANLAAMLDGTARGHPDRVAPLPGQASFLDGPINPRKIAGDVREDEWEYGEIGHGIVSVVYAEDTPGVVQLLRSALAEAIAQLGDPAAAENPARGKGPRGRGGAS